MIEATRGCVRASLIVELPRIAGESSARPFVHSIGFFTIHKPAAFLESFILLMDIRSANAVLTDRERWILRGDHHRCESRAETSVSQFAHFSIGTETASGEKGHSEEYGGVSPFLWTPKEG